MHLTEIKAMLNTKPYDFLRTDEHVKDRVMLLTVGGSHAYGTDMPDSDVDIRGIVVEGPRELLGLSRFEQFEDVETDTVLYSLRKLVSLLLNCNPNTLEILGTKPEHILTISDEGKLLKNNVQLFLSRRAAASFGGYANQQLRRLQNALARDSYPQTEKEQHILGSILVQLEHLKQHYSPFAADAIQLYIDTSARDDFETEIFVDLVLKHYPLRDFANINSEMAEVIGAYTRLGKRNKKKDVPHLNKHAMHLIRLYLMGTEILQGKGINTYREGDRELLLAIRKGAYSYSQIFEMVDEYERAFTYAKINSLLPSEPDLNKVEELVMEINRRLVRYYEGR